MAEPGTIGRPYAEAVFRLADDRGRLSEWSDTLANLAAVVADDRVRAAIDDPALAPARIAGLIIGILSSQLSAYAENLVRVLAENGRLGVLPEIRTQFESLRNQREGVIEAEIRTAFDMEPAQLADLVSRLEQKTGRRVKARVEVDRSLIGGVRIVLGDKVVDGSVRAQLAGLETALKV